MNGDMYVSMYVNKWQSGEEMKLALCCSTLSNQSLTGYSGGGPALSSGCTRLPSSSFRPGAYSKQLELSLLQKPKAAAAAAAAHAAAICCWNCDALAV